MITVQEAEKLILDNIGDFGNEIIPFDQSLGRVLAENIKADRDLPPFDRVTMDGIAIRYDAIAAGIRTFTIRATQAAGDTPIEIENDDQCVEIMTGAALPLSVDTVIRYEDLEVIGEEANLLTIEIKQGQNIHTRGSDRKQGELLLTPGRKITPAEISLIASVGESEVRVKRLPRIVILSSGDELVEVTDTPSPYQIRRSNAYMMKAMLAQEGLDAAMLHVPDDAEVTHSSLQQCLQNFDVILLSGGVSMGKFDYVPQALNALHVEQVFHKVQQRPGKPFWFGKHSNGVVVFAFPGNPVAAFMCMQRYFALWLNASLNANKQPSIYAILNADFEFRPQLQYFLQVKLNYTEQGQLLATPVAGNGSGDFANLADTDAFMELPQDKSTFKRGEVYQIWRFNN